jgi:hypothetical protein
LFTVIACVTFVVIGIVGAMKMENHLEPRSVPSDTQVRSEG